MTLPTLNEISPASLHPAPANAPENNQPDLVFKSRQVAVVSFVVILLMVMVAAISYLAGRVVMAAPEEKRKAEQKAVERVIVVDSVNASNTPVRTPMEPAKPLAVGPVATTNAASTAASTPVPSHPGVPAPAAAPTQLYFQVAAVDRGMSEVTVEYLTRKGMSALMATGPDANTFRVLVGPLGDDAEITAIRAKLEQAGFHPFLKNF